LNGGAIMTPEKLLYTEKAHTIGGWDGARLTATMAAPEVRALP
jgi:hypothetical protein